MMKRAWILVVLLVGAVGCAGEETQQPPPPPAECALEVTDALGDGDHVLEVTLSDESTESVWIHATSPAEDGPFPIIVYGGDQDLDSYANCFPAGMPQFDGDLGIALAGAGYLAVEVGFRNVGDTAPSSPTLRLRDHYLFDARAMLTAARWAREKHGKGGTETAIIGHGQATSPAFWSITNHPQLSDLQECVNIRTVILAGESANHVASVRALEEKYSGAMGDAIIQLEAVAGIAAQNLIDHARAGGAKQLVYADATGGDIGTRLGGNLQGATVNLLRVISFDPADTAMPGCSALANQPAACDPACLASAATSVAMPTDFADLNMWFTPTTLAAYSWWNPPGQISPTEDDTATNGWLAAMVLGSPVYSAQGQPLPPRALHLLSSNDASFRAEAQTLLVDKLTALGIANVEAPAIAADLMGGACAHGDYFLAARPQCGWEQTLAELQASFVATQTE